MPRAMITGGAGFLGSHLCDRLLAEGWEVVCVDNLITGSPDNIAHIRNPRFTFVQYDVTNYLYVDGPLDAVLHFASPASPIDYQELPIQTLKVGSLGTHKALGLAKAKKARFLLASTSEVYGDPLINPQTENYWGNVNPVGPRGVYDEAKRFAEAMTMAYHRYHGVDTRIVRIFNSIMGDETVMLFNDATAHIEPIEEYVDSQVESRLVVPRRIYVPAFDPATFRVELRLANTLIKHRAFGKDAYSITTRYGRRIRVTGDHSVFRRSKDGRPEAVPARGLSVGDYIAIPARLPVVEQDVPRINVAEHLIKDSPEEELWNYAVVSPQLGPAIEAHKDFIFDLLTASSRFDGSRSVRNTVGCEWRKFRREATLPLSIAAALWRRGLLQWPEDALLRPCKGRGGAAIRNIVPVTADLLWLLGLYVAEGCHVEKDGDYRILLTSNEAFVKRAEVVLQSHFGVRPTYVPATAARAPTLYANSKLLLYVFRDIFRVTGKANTARIPAWVMQLPLSRVKHFLEGYREGDGTHTNYPGCRELAFNTVSERLATDLSYLLLRFGVVASIGRYTTTFKERYGDRAFPFWRVTVCEVSDFDILSWDRGVVQQLSAKRLGDLVWAPVKEITRIETTPYVYDFSVDGHENFVAGNGIFAHNTFGPRMRGHDGRVVPAFTLQALNNEDLTVFGNGTQTRSFCYVDDLIEGIWRVLNSSHVGPVNIGNPQERTVLEFAEIVKRVTGSESRIVHKPLPIDDPRVRRPDIGLARKLFGWEPRVPIEEGLARTVEYYRARLAAGRGDGTSRPVPRTRS